MAKYKNTKSTKQTLQWQEETPNGKVDRNIDIEPQQTVEIPDSQLEEIMKSDASSKILEELEEVESDTSSDIGSETDPETGVNKIPTPKMTSDRQDMIAAGGDKLTRSGTASGPGIQSRTHRPEDTDFDDMQEPKQVSAGGAPMRQRPMAAPQMIDPNASLIESHLAERDAQVAHALAQNEISADNHTNAAWALQGGAGFQSSDNTQQGVRGRMGQDRPGYGPQNQGFDANQQGSPSRVNQGRPGYGQQNQSGYDAGQQGYGGSGTPGGSGDLQNSQYGGQYGAQGQHGAGVPAGQRGRYSGGGVASNREATANLPPDSVTEQNRLAQEESSQQSESDRSKT